MPGRGLEAGIFGFSKLPTPQPLYPRGVTFTEFDSAKSFPSFLLRRLRADHRLRQLKDLRDIRHEGGLNLISYRNIGA